MTKAGIMVLGLTALLAGCQNQPNNNTNRCVNPTCQSENQSTEPLQAGSIRPTLGSASPATGRVNNGWEIPYQYVTSLQSNKQLNDYVAQMAMKLVETFHYFPVESKVAVASFVDLDSELNRTNVIGNQLAEAFIHQLQQFGVQVVDFKTTRDIQVTASGDFVFSRDHNKLNQLQQIDYVLSGTMVFTPRGIMINARVINSHTKVVAASAQQLIPHFVVSSIYPSITR